MLEGSNVLHLLWTIELSKKYYVTVIWTTELNNEMLHQLYGQ